MPAPQKIAVSRDRSDKVKSFRSNSKPSKRAAGLGKGLQISGMKKKKKKKASNYK